MVDEMTQSERSRVVVVRFVLRSVAPRVDENFNQCSQSTGFEISTRACDRCEQSPTPIFVFVRYWILAGFPEAGRRKDFLLRPCLAKGRPLKIDSLLIHLLGHRKPTNSQPRYVLCLILSNLMISNHLQLLIRMPVPIVSAIAKASPTDEQMCSQQLPYLSRLPVTSKSDHYDLE